MTLDLNVGDAFEYSMITTKEASTHPSEWTTPRLVLNIWPITRHGASFEVEYVTLDFQKKGKICFYVRASGMGIWPHYRKAFIEPGAEPTPDNKPQESEALDRSL